MVDLTNLEVPSIRQTDAELAPGAALVGSLIASIAGNDGVLTPREYAAGFSVADVVAGLSEDPAVVRSLILRAFEGAPKATEIVLKALAASRETLPEVARRPLLEALLPLLATQNDQARPLARKIGDALDLKNVDVLLQTSDLPSEGNSVKALFRRAGSAFSKSSSDVNLAHEILDYTGDEDLRRVLQSERHDRDQQLKTAVIQTFDRLRETLATLQNGADAQAQNRDIANSLKRNADELERQFKARLRSIGKRLVVQRRHITEDIADLSESGGDEAEVDLRRMSEKRGILLRNDDRDVRERMISKSFAHRHDRLKRRHDEQIQLLRDELAEYRDDFEEAAKHTIAAVSLAEWRLAIPGATTGARVKDVLDQGATRTLTTGAVVAAGAAGAVGVGWIPAAAVAGVVAAPVGVVVLGVVAAAGVWKLYGNRDERLRSEQRSRAEAIRKATLAKSSDALSEVSVALDEIAADFRQVSLSRLTPLRQNVERIQEMCELQQELTRRINLDAQYRLERWSKSLAASP